MDTPYRTRQYGAGLGANRMPPWDQLDLLHCSYDTLCHFLGLIRPEKARLRSKMRHSLTLNVTGASRESGSQHV